MIYWTEEIILSLVKSIAETNKSFLIQFIFKGYDCAMVHAKSRTGFQMC